MKKRWYHNTFDEVYVETYKRLCTPKLTREQGRFIQKELGLSAGMDALDLGCGYGRHSLELARRGIHVTALDQSEAMLAIATPHKNIEYIRQDMLTVKWGERFDGIYWSSFGYFTRRENARVLKRMGQALRPGGRLLIGVTLRDWWQQNPINRRWHDAGDDVYFLVDNKYSDKTRTYVCKTMILRPGYTKPAVRVSKGHVYSVEEWPDMAAASGLRFLGTRSTDAGENRAFVHVLLEKPEE